MENTYCASAKDFYNAAVGAVEYMHKCNMNRDGLVRMLHTYALIMEEVIAYNGIPSYKTKDWDELKRMLRREDLVSDIIAGKKVTLE